MATSTASPTPAPPALDLDQRMQALALANGIRSKRAELKVDLKAGRKKLVPLLLDPPEWLLTAKVFDVLVAVPKIGRVKANRVLNVCRISPSKTIGGMTERQRAELVSQIGVKGWRQ